MNWRALAQLIAASAGVAPAAAQVDPSVGLGVGTVRFEGGSGFSSGALSPDIRYTSPLLAADVSGSIASLPGGVWSTQGRADVWGATARLSHGLRVGGEAIFGGTTRSDSGWTAATHGVVELLWSAPRWGIGVGAGPSGGWIANAGGVGAFHTRARAWWRDGHEGGGTEWQVSLEPTRFPDGWFTDAGVSATLRRGRAVVLLWTGARLSSVYGSTGAGSASLQWFLAPTWSLELGGGSYLRDPYQGLPRAGFVTLGVRLHGLRRPAAVAPAVEETPLVPTVRGDSLVVRFRMERARSVALAGDWNAWQPLPLRPVGDDLWEGMLALRSGLYHFNLLVDGTDWVVPRGVGIVSDGLGGMVGVLVVP
ncbi:MAG TPA: glycogen-binding domain-containing protein [Gemmatimonadales bacterium]|nr:glycogen-binding domain-containing protein [Gemmatimonadales bacterium]